MNDKPEIVRTNIIQSRIFAVRGVQVMLDSDLAEMYSVETKNLNRAVSRNKERFPEKFRFQLTKNELDEFEKSLRFQFGTSKEKRGGRRYLPYVFTEQGVSMLSAVLRSETAIKVSIQIIDAFVEMRKFISQNGNLFQRINNIEQKQIASDVKQLETDNKIDAILDAIEARDIKPKQGIFYDGQVFDAYVFVADLIKSAQKSIIIIDNYIDDSVLTQLAKKKHDVKVTILTKKISRQLALDAQKFNAQYPTLEIKEFLNAHDRFLIIDDSTLYHFGASLKDLGKKWFAFSKMEMGSAQMLAKLTTTKKV